MLVQGEKFVWHVPEEIQTKEKIKKLAYACQISFPLAKILISRGIETKEDAFDFFFTEYEKNVFCSSKLKDANKAVTRILKAIENEEKILIFGDYDVDGMTSTSIILLALIPLGAKINFYLPNRKKDGYGLSSRVVEIAKKNNYKLIITVDNGTTAHEPAKLAKKLGLDLIITDHHQPKSELPECLALVNPHQKNCSYPNKDFCGAGVAFKIMDLLYKEKKMQLPAKVYELLAMGTIADVVPLEKENRYWVKKGIQQINQSMSFSLKCLTLNCPNKEVNFWTSTDLAFSILPQLNALGRLDDPKDAIEFLISPDFKQVEKIGRCLKNINEERKIVESKIYSQVEAKIKSNIIDLEKEFVIVDSDSSWPAGVIGLVAGKLTHNFGRPTILLHEDKKEKILKGSCRSIKNFNIFKALEKCQDLLLSFGGHELAAGLSLKQENLEKFKDKISKLVSDELKIEELVSSVKVDANLDFEDLKPSFLKELERMEPFGNKNPVPVFHFSNICLARLPQILKEKHVKCMFYDNGILKPVIFFNRPDLFEKLEKNQDKPISFVGTVNENFWNGKSSIQILGIDVKF